MTVSNLDFSSLPTPDILEALSFDEIFAARKQRFIEYAPQYAEALELQSDPLTICLQVESYQELLLRQKLNEVAKANLLALATGGDLEHLGAFYGIARLANEPDDALRLRIRESTIASSTAGSLAHYRHQALSAASLQIRDISVSSDEEQSGDVTITVLVKDDETRQEVMEKVKKRVLADDVKMLTDTVNVIEAEQVEVEVEADIYLSDNIPDEHVQKLEQALKTAWQNAAVLGWELTPSWINAQLHTQGVRRVELNYPNSPVKTKASQYAVLKNIKLNLVK